MTRLTCPISAHKSPNFALTVNIDRLLLAHLCHFHAFSSLWYLSLFFYLFFFYKSFSVCSSLVMCFRLPCSSFKLLFHSFLFFISSTPQCPVLSFISSSAFKLSRLFYQNVMCRCLHFFFFCCCGNCLKVSAAEKAADTTEKYSRTTSHRSKSNRRQSQWEGKAVLPSFCLCSLLSF